MPDDMGDRMKAYEAAGTSAKLDSALPICARIDGRSFSTFTRGYDRPFDSRISSAMRAACSYLVDQTHAKIGYTQSDEISLVWQAADGGSIIFDGKVHKMTSVLASMAAVKFYSALGGSGLPTFDCRVWEVPSQTEAANTLLWRAMDCRKNAVSSACRAYFSPKQMHGQGRAEQMGMLASVGVDFDTNYDIRDRYGVWFRRVTGLTQINDATWRAIPEKHRPADRRVMRSWVAEIQMPFFGDVSNREAVIFDAAKPIQ